MKEHSVLKFNDIVDPVEKVNFVINILSDCPEGELYEIRKLVSEKKIDDDFAQILRILQNHEGSLASTLTAASKEFISSKRDTKLESLI